MMLRLTNSNSLTHRTLLYLRYLIFSCSLLLLAAIFTFPVPATHTYLNQSSGSWHGKVNKSAETGSEEVSDNPNANEPVQLQEPHKEGGLLLDQEVILPKLPRILRAYHFRPPPLM